MYVSNTGTPRFFVVVFSSFPCFHFEGHCTEKSGANFMLKISATQRDLKQQQFIGMSLEDIFLDDICSMIK